MKNTPATPQALLPRPPTDRACLLPRRKGPVGGGSVYRGGPLVHRQFFRVGHVNRDGPRRRKMPELASKAITFTL